MKRNLKVFAALAVISMAAFTSCTKDAVNNLSNAESRIYITNHDSTVNFSSYKTFSISDSVTIIDNGQVSKSFTSTDQAFIDATIKYMQLMGYTLVGKSSNPDVGINISQINNTSTGIISYGSYWDYYGGYWDPAYWGYGGYNYYMPYGYDVYQLNQGALSIDMLDLKNAAANNRIKIIWTGLIRGEGIMDASTADSQVKILFDQSAYLKTN